MSSCDGISDADMLTCLGFYQHLNIVVLPFFMTFKTGPDTGNLIHQLDSSTWKTPGIQKLRALTSVLLHFTSPAPMSHHSLVLQPFARGSLVGVGCLAQAFAAK